MPGSRVAAFSARRDEAFVGRLAQALERAGSAFMHDRGSLGGTGWAERVAEAARRNDFLILVWSDATCEEDIWRPFAEDAVARLRLVLVIARKAPVPAALDGTSRIDLSRWRGASDNPALGQLESLLQGGGSPQLPPARRLYRGLRLRLALIASAFTLCVPCAGFAFNLFGAQDSLCRLSAVSDWCGEWKLGGQPTRAERLAWERLDRSSPTALKAFITTFPEGVHHGAAADLLQACGPVRAEEWVPHRSTVAIMVPRFLATAPRESEARARAASLAAEDAAKACKAHGYNDGFRYTGRNELRLDSLKCSDVGGKIGCDADGWALCEMLRIGSGRQWVCSNRAAAPPPGPSR